MLSDSCTTISYSKNERNLNDDVSLYGLYVFLHSNNPVITPKSWAFSFVYLGLTFLSRTFSYFQPNTHQCFSQLWIMHVFSNSAWKK